MAILRMSYAHSKMGFARDMAKTVFPFGDGVAPRMAWVVVVLLLTCDVLYCESLYKVCSGSGGIFFAAASASVAVLASCLLSFLSLFGFIYLELSWCLIFDITEAD